MARVLFVHNGSPGRFAFIAGALRASGHTCALINGPGGNDIPGIPSLQWKSNRGSTPGIYPPATRAEADFLRGRATAECASHLRQGGFNPDLIIGHPGWGEMLFLREVFPQAPQVQLGEFYYRTEGGDIGFDPEFDRPQTMDERVRVHAKNAGLALSYAEAEQIVVPTPFQASVIPGVFQSRIRIIHEGVDTAVTRPQPDAKIALEKNGRVLDRMTPVVTFINRHLEPLRGFHIFMRALPRLLTTVPDVHVLIIGADRLAGYGPKPPREGVTWKQLMLEELQGQLDGSRVHFVGQLAYDQLMRVLSISRAHVYMTYPFVLSWSLLDAMACECLIIGSDTAPVRDVIRPGKNGLLVDFFDHKALADALTEACVVPDQYEEMRRSARATIVDEFDRKTVCEPAWLSLINEVLSEVSEKFVPRGVSG